jgi:hypothetical protein
MADDTRRCTATSKTTGERCRQTAAPGCSVCRFHGAGGGAPRGNLNHLIHGAYAKRTLSDEEQRIRDAFLDELRRDFALNCSSDEVSAQMAAMAFLQYIRAQKAGKEAAAASQARIVRNCLRDLKATKSARERGPVDLKTTPAEWATALVQKIRDAEGKRRAKNTKPRKRKAANADPKAK